MITGITLIILAALSWSTLGLLTRLLTVDLPTLLFWSSVFGGSCAFAFYWLGDRNRTLRQALRFSRGDLLVAALSAGGMICFISAFFFTSIAKVYFIYGAAPLVTAVLGVVILRERLTGGILLSGALSLAGVGLMMLDTASVGDLTGVALVIGMTVLAALITLFVKRFDDVDTVKVIYLSSFLTALVSLPFSTMTGLTAADYAWLAAFGVLDACLGFGCYLLGVTRLRAVVAATVSLIEIPLAPIWAFIIIGEEVNGQVLTGGAVLLTAALISIFAKQSSPVAEGAA